MRLRALITCVALALGAAAAHAQGNGLLGQEKMILPQIKANWIAFRDYDGRQYIYFTILVAYRCGLSEVRYSLNSDALDRRFALPHCDPERPQTIDAVKYPPYLAMALNTADEAAVQLVFKDGTASEIVRYKPCANAGESTCARLVD